MAEVEVLRLGHRPGRDKRVTTHVALVARALGAERMHLHQGDERISKRVEEVNARFGGAFEVIPCAHPLKEIEEFDGIKVHLTMYGIPLKQRIEEIKRADRVLAIVGAEKVPRAVYEKVDYNISITSQPHSEVAALALMLSELKREPYFTGGIYIVPKERGKSTSKYPPRDLCMRILEDKGVPKGVIEHSIEVERIAISVGRRIEREDKDLDLIRAGALLHDIGRCRSHAIDHSILGAQMAREMMLPDELALIIERHVGGGLSKEEASRLGLPPKDYLPETLEEKIVSYADNIANDKAERAPPQAREMMARLAEEIKSLLD